MMISFVFVEFNSIKKKQSLVSLPPVVSFLRYLLFS